MCTYNPSDLYTQTQIAYLDITQYDFTGIHVSHRGSASISIEITLLGFITTLIEDK